MKLYRQKKKRLSAVSLQNFQTEKEIQSVVENNLDTLFGLTLVSSEFIVREFRLDTLAFDDENNAFVIIEYKKGRNYSVVDQGFSYLSQMLDNKANFIVEYNEKRGETLKLDDVNWDMSRILFVSSSFNRYQINSANFPDIPFELWEVRRFSNDLILIDQIKTNSKEGITSLFKKNTKSLINKVSSEVTVISEEDLAQKLTSDEWREGWEKLREEFDGWSDTRIKATKSYIGLYRNINLVCAVYFNRDSLRLIIRAEHPNKGSTKRNRNTFQLAEHGRNENLD